MLTGRSPELRRRRNATAPPSSSPSPVARCWTAPAILVHLQTPTFRILLQTTPTSLLNSTSKAVGIPKKLAPTIGISVDHHRNNISLDGLQVNFQRLKTYKAKLVIFPRRARKVKVGDSTPKELATATQVQGDYMPIARAEKRLVEVVKVDDEMNAFKAYAKLRVERMNQRQIGARQKKAAEAEKEEKK